MRTPSRRRLARHLLPLAAAGLLLAACAGPSYGPGGSGGYARPTGPVYKIGAPYQIDGIWYYPRVDYGYDKTGTASWYGEDFNGRYTANGEVYDLNRLTAAHRTLPMPSIVEVTNLNNGRTLRLRVNDRGPFADGRIIDVSRRAAQLLGFETAGTAPVRVRILPVQSIAAAAAVMRRSGQNPEMLAQYAPPGLIQEAMADEAEMPEPAASAPVIPQAVAPAPVIREAAAAPVIQEPRYPAPVIQEPRYPAPVIQEPVVRPPPVQQAMAPPPRWPAEQRPPELQEALVRRAPPLREAIARERPAAVPVAAPTFFHTLRITPRRRHIFVQAGSFTQVDHAIQLSSRIAPLGVVAIVTSSQHGYPVYRVRLGPVANGREAEDLLARLVGSGYAGARIVEN